jgi:hypothetical protein
VNLVGGDKCEGENEERVEADDCVNEVLIDNDGLIGESNNPSCWIIFRNV